MSQAVQDFIDQMKVEYAKARIEEKKALVDRVGLYEKEFYDKKTVKDQGKRKAEIEKEYPFVTYESGVQQRYKKIYPELTNEEYETVKTLQESIDKVQQNKQKNESKKVSSTGSGIATALTLFAIVLYFGAFIAGIVMGNADSIRGFNLGSAIIYWMAGAFSGTLLLGFASVVENLKIQTELLKEILQE